MVVDVWTAVAAGLNSITSALITRPLGPVPFIWLMSNPFWAAVARAKGDANLRVESEVAPEEGYAVVGAVFATACWGAADSTGFAY